MDGMDHLANLLAVVKNDGWDAAFEDNALYAGHLSGAEYANFQVYREPLRSLRHSIEDAKLCMASLHNIKVRLASKIRNLQKRCAPLVLEDGIERIPDEILAHIFEAGHQLSESSEFALRVSRVSRRFRQVSLQTPSLWTRLSSEQPNDQIEVFISRSGRLDLRVELSQRLPNSVAKLRSSLQLLSPHSRRWSKLLLTVNPSYQYIMDDFGLTSFPRLRYICHKYYSMTRSSQWDMPLFSKFGAHCLQFPPGVSFPFLLQLTSMELYFEDEDPFDMENLAEVLYGMMNLRHLVLEFLYYEDYDVDFEAGVQGPMSARGSTPKPHSFHAESLRITLRGYVKSAFIDSLFTILNYLTALLVDISVQTYGDPDDILTHTKFPYGSTVKVRTGLPCSVTMVLEELLLNCPITRSVQFEMASFSQLIYMPKWSIFPSFHHLRLHNCFMLEEKHVQVITRCVLQLEDFQLLEIISCQGISEEFLMDLQDELGERLIWSL